jgi:aminoglycoside 3-N-acetyltransferase
VLTKTQLIEELKAIGVAEGMDLLVHSALRRVGPVEGRADGIIDAMLELIGPEGTLMMSTVSGNVNPEQTAFHAAHTPSTVGMLGNVFRKRPGAIRSLHPVHSVVAMGPKAKFYTEGHLEANTPWSPDSPYGKLMRNNGYILFLGTSFEANTCIHALEIEARVPGLHSESTQTLQVIDYDGTLQEIEHRWHAPKTPCYPDLEHLVERAGGLTYGRVGNSISRFVDATVLRETLLPLFLETPELGIVRLTDSQFVWE